MIFNFESFNMSSNKSLIPKCVSKNSDSFEDRICDDLSEVLLQFLPLEDKQRLECVSKQFQRTVFRKQYKITLYSCLQLNHEISKQNEDKVFKINYLKSIESVLKKCPNIQTITLFLKNKRIFESIVPLITKYCDHLNEFNVSLKTSRSKPELNKEFLRKFGSKLKYISCGHNLDNNLFPNLYSVKRTDFHLISTERLLALNHKNLKELNVNLYQQNQHFLSEVLQKFHKIRRLSLNLSPDNSYSLVNAFNESPVLQNLIELKYNTNSAENAKQFLDLLKKFAEKLPKLKSIAFELVLEKDFSDLRLQLSPLKAFPELKRLDLGLIFLKSQNKSRFSLKAFEELQNITHLRLSSKVRQMNGKVLTNIDIYLPKLQYLYIYPEIITDEEGVKQMAESLSRLSSLHTIQFEIKLRTH